MNDLGEKILKILCGGAGQGNSNTDKLTRAIMESNPDLNHDQTKIEVVESLRELSDRGEIQIMTLNWELGEEFLYVCTNIID
ncbi:MAG: hypothetical protein RIG61_09485 [Deltaproteobacteria bacterium]